MSHGSSTPQAPAAHPVTRAVGVISEIAGLVAGFAMVAATLVTAWGVFVRYVLRQPTVWQTEATVYLLILVAFVGAAYGVKHHSHVGVDLLVERLSLRRQAVVRVVTSVLVVGVVAAVFWTSFEAWLTAYSMDHRSATAWRAPLWVPYAFLPLGMLLVAAQYLAMIYEAVLGLRGRIPLERVSLLGGTSELAQVRAELEEENAAAVAEGAGTADSDDPAVDADSEGASRWTR